MQESEKLHMNSCLPALDMIFKAEKIRTLKKCVSEIENIKKQIVHDWNVATISCRDFL